jgi:hypothetical protein
MVVCDLTWKELASYGGHRVACEIERYYEWKHRLTGSSKVVASELHPDGSPGSHR